MTLLHADGFGSYGTDKNNLTRGVYALADSRMSLQTTPLRSNLTTHNIRYSVTAGGPDFGNLRFVLDSLQTELITGCAYRIQDAPGSNGENAVFTFSDSVNNNQVSLSVGTNLSLQLRSGSIGGTLIAESDANVIAADNYEFIEIYLRAGSAGSPGGSVEVRVNGVTVINESGVATIATAVVGYQSVYIACGGGSGSETSYQQDWYILNTSGSVNNDFIGDTVWYTDFPTGDGTPQDFVPSATGDAYLMIDDADPDDDTTYIQAVNANEESQFTFDALPSQASTVVGTLYRALTRKTDAGAAELQVSMVSAENSPATRENGAVISITETYDTVTEIFETDPATSSAWTVAAANAQQVNLDKTS